ncbi:MAG: hypothetical protein GX539_17020 [Candidatus Cloacimonetes bacterium]|jgi:opacity protein-like surface antigen|nr:hypothetical protein [Candidatus Cloacimonadota bacterium]
MRKLLLFGFLMLTSVSAAQAQTLADYDYENLTFRGFGFDYGYIWPNKVESTDQYSVRLDLGFLGPAVRIATTLSYWSSAFKEPELQRLADRLEQLPALQEQGVDLSAADLGRVRWSDVSATVDAHMVWTVPGNIITYLGAGLGIHALNGRGTSIEDTFVEDLLDSISPAIAFSAGAEYQLVERIRLYGEGRYTLLSDIHYPGLRAGVSIMLPQRPASAGTTGGGR